jgi:hypothetical protein
VYFTLSAKYRSSAMIRFRKPDFIVSPLRFFFRAEVDEVRGRQAVRRASP